MKIAQYILFILFIGLYGCSSSDSPTNNSNDSNDDNNPPTNQNLQYISKVRDVDADSWNKGEQFYYENDKLLYVYLYSCSGEVIAFDYNSNGKVSKRYTGTVSFFDSNTFNLESFKQENNAYALTCVYENNKLVRMVDNNGATTNEFIYNSSGQLISAKSGFNSLLEEIVIFYDGENITSLNKTEYELDGTVDTDYLYTFQFDDKLNPLYELNNEFNFLYLTLCNGFDYISSGTSYMVFKNNVTKVLRGGDILFNASYEYNQDNYPIKVTYTNYNGDYSAIQNITY